MQTHGQKGRSPLSPLSAPLPTHAHTHTHTHTPPKSHCGWCSVWCQQMMLFVQCQSNPGLVPGCFLSTLQLEGWQPWGQQASPSTEALVQFTSQPGWMSAWSVFRCHRGSESSLNTWFYTVSSTTPSPLLSTCQLLL